MKYMKMSLEPGSYNRSCTVVSGDVLEDFRYVFKELLDRVGFCIIKYLLIVEVVV